MILDKIKKVYDVVSLICLGGLVLALLGDRIKTAIVLLVFIVICINGSTSMAIKIGGTNDALGSLEGVLNGLIPKK